MPVIKIAVVFDDYGYIYPTAVIKFKVGKKATDDHIRNATLSILECLNLTRVQQIVCKDNPLVQGVLNEFFEHKLQDSKEKEQNYNRLSQSEKLAQTSGPYAWQYDMTR